MPIATIGRIVHVRGINSNGSDVQPAIITRAWSTRPTEEGPVGVNLTVFSDTAAPLLRGSVMLYDTEDLAGQACVGRSHEVVAYWPPQGPAIRTSGPEEGPQHPPESLLEQFQALERRLVKQLRERGVL